MSSSHPEPLVVETDVWNVCLDFTFHRAPLKDVLQSVVNYLEQNPPGFVVHVNVDQVGEENAWMVNLYLATD